MEIIEDRPHQCDQLKVAFANFLSRFSSNNSFMRRAVTQIKLCRPVNGAISYVFQLYSGQQKIVDRVTLIVNFLFSSRLQANAPTDSSHL